MNGRPRCKHGTEDRRWLAQIEARLGVALVNRNTRRMSLTPECEVFLDHAQRILGEIDDLNQLLATTKGAPKGLLRVNATLGFGRLHVAPVISRYVSRYPEVDVQLQLSVNPPPGTEPQAAVCRAKVPHRPWRTEGSRRSEAPRLHCHQARGRRLWHLAAERSAAREAEAVKVRGNLATNDGEIAVGWALDGHGILLRAEWGIARHFRSGRLVQVLPQYRAPDADIYAVYPQRPPVVAAGAQLRRFPRAGLHEL